ncbi:MAG: hypothetical protein JO215_02385 [Ktedonobacteraceae bacterium]|nr:hypothetical protein [Ktedonobacteraceae bacterium]MBV9617297.1 hypothetical protein [Ktedonobacteraceae bacterium]
MGENKSHEGKETKQDQRQGQVFRWRPGAPTPTLLASSRHLPPKKRGKDV